VKIVSTLSAAVADTADQACEDIFALIGAGGLTATATALETLAGLELSPEDPRAQAVVIEILALALECFAAQPCSAEGHAALALFDPAHAMRAANLLFSAHFPDGDGDLALLPDATVLCIASLFNAAGNIPGAVQLLEQALATRSASEFVAAAQYACVRFTGIGGVAGLWLGEVDGSGSLDDARARVDAQPFDMAAQRRLVRLLAESERLQDALDALMTALALPVGESDKAGLGIDLAALAVWLRGHGQGDLLNARNCYYALAASPAIISEAETALRGVDLASAGWAAIDPAAIAGVLNVLRQYRELQTPAYPMNGAKPHVDIVWLEITNFCNQKCGFCPDMHREDTRQWLPLDQVKSLIDDLAENVSVGSMQLNAYGEPLLHPHIAEILAYIREKQLPWPTYFTTHGMTLVPKKLAQLSHNYPSGIAVSMHNDSQQSYDATRSAKIGDYDTLVSRISDLIAQMAQERAPSHLRLYQMVCNGFEDKAVDPIVRSGFPDSPQRMARHVRKWEAIAARIAAELPPEQGCRAVTNTYATIEHAFLSASHGDGDHLPILQWMDQDGRPQTVFISARPVGTYGNLLLEYDERWDVKRKLVNKARCGFTANPSLAVFATGKLGICCIDMNSTAVFGSLSDFGGLGEALRSTQANRIFAELSNGVATSRGCQVCLARGEQLCGPTY